MSSKRKKEEEYRSDDDEDFVPDANDVEDEKEFYMDENEEEVALPGLGKKNAKRGRKPAITERVKRKGPFDSEDELSEDEVLESAESEEEPPAKKPKFEETSETKPDPVTKSSQVSSEDFFAAMMKGKMPPTSSVSSATVSSSTSSKTSNTSNGTSDTSDSLAFFQMMSKSASSTKSASPAPTVSPSSSKLGIPASWLKSTESDASSTADPEQIATLSTQQKVTIKERYEFAGEKIEVERKVDVREAEMLQAKKAGSGLGDLLDQLKGKSKINTLQKSKLDWNQFTEDQGLADEFEKNRKDGYIQKQEFLQNAEAAETAAYMAGKAKARR